jgi:hypothetical protein
MQSSECAEEIYPALLRAAQCGVRLGKPWAEVYRAYIGAWMARPARAEPLLELAALARGRGEHDLAYALARRASTLPQPESDEFPGDGDAHRWRALDELSVDAFYAGRAAECFELTQMLLDSGRLPEAEHSRVLFNRDCAGRARATPLPETVSGELTVVTGLIDLSAMEPRPWWRDLAGYLRDAAWILSVPCPLVVYIDPSCIDLFRLLRPDGLPTEWIPFAPEQCRWWAEREAIAQMLAFHRPAGCWVEKDTPAYHAVIYQKTEWLADAAARNPFGGRGFAWIDFGVHGYVQRPPHLDRASLASGLAALSRGPWDDRVRVCAMSPVPVEAIADPDLYYAENRSAISGGLAAGGADAVAWFATAVRDEINRCLERGIAVTDEMIWAHLLYREPGRFRPHYGSWVAAVANTGFARAQIDEIIHHAMLANDRGVTEQALARLDFIGPALDTHSPELRARALTERLRAAMIGGDRGAARQVLLSMIHGALADPAHAAALARRAAALLAITDSVVEPALETTFERLDPWTPRATRIDCIVDETFSPWMLSPLAVRYVARSRSRST